MEHCRHIGVITLFPEMLRTVLGTSIPDRARKKGLVEYHIWDLRAFGIGSYHSVDDYPFGGGGGMVLKPEPISEALDVAVQELEALSGGLVPRLVYPSPQGTVFLQQVAQSWSADPRPIIFLCGHYEGIDQRILDGYPFEEWSCGDYVLSGGELPFALMVDAVVRLIPGVLSNVESPQNETFSNGSFDFPQYTRPRVFRGREVPPVLLSGNHEAINVFREQQARKKQQEVRPDMGDARSGISV